MSLLPKITRVKPTLTDTLAVKALILRDTEKSKDETAAIHRDLAVKHDVEAAIAAKHALAVEKAHHLLTEAGVEV